MDCIRNAQQPDPVGLAPLNDFGHYCSGRIHLAAGRPVEAEKAFRQALELNPHARGRHEQLSWALLAQRRVAEAEAAVLQEHEEVYRLQGLAMVRWTQGRRDESDALLAELTRKYGVSAAYQVAELHAHRGEIDTAFHWLERAFTGYDPGVFWAKTTHFFQPLHGDPRWPVYLRKLGFTEV